MEPGYFRSREFVVALGAGLFVLLVATSGAVLTGGFEGTWGGSPCADDLRVEDLSPQNDTGPRYERGWTERAIVYRIDAGATLAVLDLCTEVGAITVESYAGDVVEITVLPRMEGAHSERVDDVRPEVVFRPSGAGGHLYVHVAHPPRSVSLLREESGSVDIEVRVPAHMVIGMLEADGDVGRRHLQDVQVGRLGIYADVGDFTVTNVTATLVTSFRVDVGDVVGTGVRFLGDVTGRTDVGDIDLDIAHVSNNTWDLRTDVGDVRLMVPGGDDHGYRVDIECDVGTARAEIGATVSNEARSSGPSERVKAESVGYAERTYRADIVIRTDVGSGTVRTR